MYKEMKRNDICPHIGPLTINAQPIFVYLFCLFFHGDLISTYFAIFKKIAKMESIKKKYFKKSVFITVAKMKNCLLAKI